MDVKNFDEAGEFGGVLRNLYKTAEQAARRRGELVDDHPSAEQLVLTFLFKLNMSTRRVGHSGTQIATTQIPPAYPPCVLPARDLQPLMISAMRLETHHRGFKTLLRVLTPPNRINAVMAIAEDQEGTAVLLQLYNMPDESVVPASHTLYENRVCVVKEPFFKCTTDGSYSLRADHVTDVVWLDADDEHAPKKWRRQQPSHQRSSMEERLQGNKAVEDNAWAEAERRYTSAIKVANTSEESRLAQLNRSLASLRLGRLESALSDARRVASDGKPSTTEKALFREARALYEMGEYRACMERLVSLAKDFPDNKAVKPELDRAQARLREQRTGQYSFRRMYTQAKVGIPVVDCATFIGPVEVRESPGRGCGVFTMAAVAAGDLLICEKAFAYSYAGDNSVESLRRITILMDVHSKTFVVGSQAHLTSQIVQKLLHDPESSKSFLDLHHDDYQPASAEEVDGRPVVDTFLVARIMMANGFATSRTTRAAWSLGWRGHAPHNPPTNSNTSCGIWTLASRVNHSCVPNCRRSFIGDMQLIRATRALPAGAELVFAYQPVGALESHAEAQKRLRNWRFACDCALCLDRQATPAAALRRRRALAEELRAILRPVAGGGGAVAEPRRVNTTRALKILLDMQDTHGTPVRSRPQQAAAAAGGEDEVRITPRMELADLYTAVAGVFLATCAPARAVEAAVRALEALGFAVVATPPGGAAGTGRLEVEAWGVVEDTVLLAFLTLFRAYGPRDTELAGKAREYIILAYSVTVGERETVGEETPEL
ncbi:TPR domain protein [Xylariaceae sp. FL0804]|nr:TPR domain protein [Xylariaceae sp. FL0804]